MSVPSIDEFVVLENDNVCVVGRVRSPDDEVLLQQNKIYDKQIHSLSDKKYTLERKDIYKELGVLGLDYGPEFQRLRKVGTNDFKEIYGVNEWTGSFITYMDALLQSMAMAAPFRKLMVPVMIRALRVDPRVLFEGLRKSRNIQAPVKSIEDYATQDNMEKVANQITGITEEVQVDVAKQDIPNVMQLYSVEVSKLYERFAIFSADMPFYFNAKSKRLVTQGIEVEDIMAFPIPRRADTMDLVTDSYEFYANEDLEAIEPLERKLLTDYVEVCKAMAAKVKQMGFKQMKCDFNYQSISDEEIQEYKNANNENHVIFRIFDKMLSELSDENKNIKTDANIHKVLNEIYANPEYDLSKDLINQISKNERMIRTLVDIVSENYVTTNDLNITEINLSSDVLAKDVDHLLTQFRIIPFITNYKLIVKSKDYVHEVFRSNAMEWDPKDDLSLKPSHLVIMRDTPDLWHKDMNGFIQDMSDNIQEKGFLLTVFRYKFTEPELALNSLNGKAVFNNTDLENRIKDFISISDSIGLRLVATKYDTIGTVALLFRQILETPKIPDQTDVINVTLDYNQWFGVLQEKLITAKDADNKTDNVWLTANTSSINGIIGLMNCVRLEPGGENSRYIFNYDNNSEKIDFTVNPYKEILTNDLVANVIRDGKVGTYRHLKLSKDCDKVLTNEYYLNLGQTRDLAGLQWYDLKTIIPAKEQYDFAGNRVTKHKVNIYSTGLSFHDVMLATGRIPPGPEVIFTDCTIGGEFAGRRIDTGERVMGMEAGRCFATSTYCSTHGMTHIPEHWSMDDAVSILSTYSTAYYGLIQKGRLRKGESILIHSAAGGVGQAAINIAKHYECDIIVTIGTEDKRVFIEKEYNIPTNRIFNSRDILFKNQIMEITEGRGVDMVLNSLSGEKLDASYECVANHGRFIEIGKFDMLQNKKLGMFDFIRSVNFIPVAIDLVLVDDIGFLPMFYEWVHKNCEPGGCLRPINQTTFKATDAEKAFRYMTTGKHSGKIILKMREEETDRRPLKAHKLLPEIKAQAKTYFDPNKVYIITGGLGGFGMELIPWMQYYGARKFVVTSRSGVKTDYQKFVFNRFHEVWKDYKFFESQWIVSTADGFTIEGTQQLLKQAQELGPIGGVFHLALELNDCLIEKLTFDKFCSSIDTKHKIFTNLDQLTRKLNYNLDYFVIFSSVTCGKGNGGQSNYSFGNSICERICEQRRGDGLHGLAVQYGPVGDVGVFADSDQLLTMTSIRKQRINSCCDVKVGQTKVESGGRQKRLVKELWRALGIDPDNTPNHLTLGEIGIESMFAVELQQELEREWNMKVTLNHVKSITIGMLKDYEAGKIGEIKKHLDDVRRAKANLLKMKFLIPYETHTRLNSVQKGVPVYILPPIEVNFAAMVELAQKINRPVIGLNWTREVTQLTTLKEVSEYYVKLLKNLEPKGSYEVLGYFDGAIICSKLLRKQIVGKAVIIDVINDAFFREDHMTDEDLLIMLLTILSRELPGSLKDKIQRDIKKEPNFNNKVKFIVNELVDLAGKGLVANDMEPIFHVMLARIRKLSEYRLNKRKKFSNRLKLAIAKKWAKRTGKLVFIKPFRFDSVEDVENCLDKSMDTYFLPSIYDNNENIIMEPIDNDNQFDLACTVIVDKIVEAFTYMAPKEMAAINMCQHYGCDIYVTVGTDEKKQFLANDYNIPVNRIFNSRDILNILC
ncbi:unnamed protein product [Oppiella nova]|uniref:Uncharacterized protein n=1 Tax=Oppiella nova TaxID=334625 RepID=A0A7R9QP61_9ACAR|nr:unnamed protein product [Oppiella nova]CAG2169908.1 unnamed protein product [Oppiella nova]